MPEVTELRPHAITCIKKSIQSVLQEHTGDNITITCDRDDCWSDDELMGKFRQAANIMTGSDRVAQNVKSNPARRKLNEPPEDFSACQYDAQLDIDITAYAELCDDDPCETSLTKAYAVIGHIISVLYQHSSDVLGRRVLYRGSNPDKNSEAETDIATVTARFEIHYQFDPAQPWRIGK